jgi:hypothetical protein
MSSPDPISPRLYDFQFVSGRPYTDEQLQHAEKCIVITDVLARRVFGTTEQVAGRQLLLNYPALSRCRRCQGGESAIGQLLGRCLPALYRE